MKHKKLTLEDFDRALKSSGCVLAGVGCDSTERLIKALNDIINPERTAYCMTVKGVGSCGEKVSVVAVRVTNRMIEDLGDQGVIDSIAKKHGIEQVTETSRMFGGMP